MNWTNGS